MPFTTEPEHTIAVQAQGREALRQTIVVFAAKEGVLMPSATGDSLTEVALRWRQTPPAGGSLTAARASRAVEASTPAGSTGFGSLLAGAGLALGATSAGLLTAHFLDHSEGRGDPLLAAGLVTGGAALAAGVGALLLSGGTPDAKSVGGRGSQNAAKGSPGGRWGGHVLVAPTPQGVSLVLTGKL